MDISGGIRNALTGALIGVAAMLPGVSGGLIAVLCGVYERIVGDVADLAHRLAPDFWFLLATGCGLLAGAAGTAVGLDGALRAHPVPCLFFFIGLILAQVPEVYRMAKADLPVKPAHAACFGLGAAVMAALLLADGAPGGGAAADGGWGWLSLLAAGVLFGVANVTPGISGSSLILAFGLYPAVTGAVADMDVKLLAPLAAGAALGIVGFAKVMARLMEARRRETYFAILGLTVGSLFTIYAGAGASGMADHAVGAAALAAGAAASWLFSRIGRRAAEGGALGG